MNASARNAEQAIDCLTGWLKTRVGLDHIKLRARGASVLLYSASEHGDEPHARVTHTGGTTWNLSFPRHTGRWERTPFYGPLDEIFAILVDMLGFHLVAR